MDGDLLVYEQDEVHTIPTSQEEFSVAGKLRIIERQRNGAVIEWRCSEDESNPDNDWAVVNTSAVTFSHHNTSDSVEISTPRRHIRPISIELIDLRSYKLSDSGSLVLIQRDGTTHPTLQFPGKDAAYFVEVLQRYVAVKQSEKDITLYLLQDKRQAEMDARLSALNLVPIAARRRRPVPRAQQRTKTGIGSSSSSSSAREAGASANSSSHGCEDSSGRSISPSIPYTGVTTVVPWANTPQRVIGFLHNFKRDPYTTTLSTLSKFYDDVLNYDWAEGMPSERGDDDSNPFSSLNGFDDLEPGFQVVSLKGDLAARQEVERLPPLTQQDYRTYCDVYGRVLEPSLLCQRIFRGGIHSSLRHDLWCCLLGHYEWRWTAEEREQRRQQRQQEYDALKLQWSTVTAEQEARNTGFRDRKSLIEKDVNRTDRSHPFYEGENNPNVDVLYNILMSYVMYNFDLGYVQGMSDLLAPILYVTQHETTAFWCFVGYIDMVHRNFDMDQSGMKEQLHALQQVIAVVDPEFMGYLESKESANLYFCFRWLLVRYKRELSYSDTLRLWEVLWSGEPCPNFHLLVAAAILDHERNTIMENKFGFTEILKHINDTSQRLDLECTLRTAEAIYHQLASSPNVPAAILELLGLPVPPQSQENEVGEVAVEGVDAGDAAAILSAAEGEDKFNTSSRAVIVSRGSDKNKEDFVLFRRSDYTGKEEDDETESEGGGSSESGAGTSSNGAGLQQRGLVGTVTTMLGSAVRHIAGDDLTAELLSPLTSLQPESLFEEGINRQYL